MGHWKNVQADQEDERNTALDILIESGCIVECENHPGTYYCGDADKKDAYMLVNTKISQENLGEATPEYRLHMTDLIKDVYDDNAAMDYCPYCEKNMRD